MIKCCAYYFKNAVRINKYKMKRGIILNGFSFLFEAELYLNKKMINGKNI